MGCSIFKSSHGSSQSPEIAKIVERRRSRGASASGRSSVSSTPRGSLRLSSMPIEIINAHRINRILNNYNTSSVFVTVDKCPTLDPKDVEKLRASLKIVTNPPNPDQDLHHFSQWLSKQFDILDYYFSNTNVDIPSIPYLSQDEKVAHHQKEVNRVIINCFEMAFNQNLSSAQTTLKRLGAFHAEFYVTGKDVMAFEESFLFFVESMDKTMTPSRQTALEEPCSICISFHDCRHQ
ncbi:uncharacterized protein LOC131950546 [Physella acuta]|uniref:uncharacterized protein LOC131950546 n=1 Tax=Physella acuta TaxID=109671 RepID=UPI0027DC973B|nr:uncharacterized protein LOC131950546 [Physella acuta]